MSRLPAVVTALLAAATAGAFFFVQHLKVTTPLIAGPSAPNPGAINPHAARPCGGVDHRTTTVTFYLLHRADDVDVYVVDQSGDVVATLASGRHMRTRVRFPDGVFTWNGREDDGKVAPDGSYFVQVDLIHQGRSVVLSQGASPLAIKVETRAPRPVVTSVQPQLVPHAGSTSVTLRYAGNEGHAGTVRLYRTDLPGRPRLVKSFLTPFSGQRAVWDGTIAGRPAPAGTYLVGLDVTDAACNTGRFPAQLPPRPGSTPHAGVTVRYLAAQPPLGPVRAGSRATVYVDSRQQPYRWALRHVGAAQTLETGRQSSFLLRVPVPGGTSGLYELAIRSGAYRTTVPLTATGPAAPVLIVLPALTWQGLDAVDDTGDGVPDLLATGNAVRLARPLVGGLPAGSAEEGTLLAYLGHRHRSFELTSDLALIQGRGPALAGHRGVILAGSERWISPSLADALRRYVRGGGRVLSIGLQSLRAYVTVSGGQARSPTPLSTVDIFGVHHGAFVAHDSGLLAVISDGLGLFARTAGVFPGFSAYEPITGAAGSADLVSAAGTSSTTLGIAGLRLGSGTVVEVGLPGFAAALARSADAGEILDGIWSQLTG